MAEFKRSSKLPARKSIRSKMIERVQRMEGGSAYTGEKIEQQTFAVEQVARTQKMRSIAVNKVPRGKARNRRTGPLGKMARISDGAVDSIAEDMEKRTRRAIAIIGRSKGF